MMDKYWLYITCKDVTEAHMIGREIVQERLVACVNILGNMSSMYWWNGEIVEDKEVILIAKTQGERLKEVEQKILDLHSYDVPCIICLPIVEGHQPYLEWIAQSTRK